MNRMPPVRSFALLLLSFVAVTGCGSSTAEAPLVCGASVACAQPLVCGPDSRCRNSCKTKADCIGSQLCVAVASNGNGVCADTTETLPPPDGGAPGGTDGGTGGAGGSGGGTGGAPDAGAGDASDGNDINSTPDGQGDAQGDAGDAPDSSPEVAACGALGQACCAGTSCSDGLSCLNGVSCSCAKTLFGRYLLRTNGNLLYEEAPPSTAQTPVIDASTGLPLAGVTAAMDGVDHGCALQGATKTVWCWRRTARGNSFGQLGGGVVDSSGPTFRATKVLIQGNTPLADIVVLADGTANYFGLNTCAATMDGKLYCWGDVTWILNNGSTALNSPYAIPVTTDGVTPLVGVRQVGLSGPYQIASDLLYACAIVQGASSTDVWCWGANNSQCLGTGDTTPRPFPTKVLGLTNPTKVLPFGAYGSACALDGSNVRCWGANPFGQVGNGMTNSPVSAPSPVTLMGGNTALTNIVDIRAGYSDAICALAGNHTVQCWGGGFQTYPATYGITDVAALGSIDDNAIRLLTGDGIYHIGSTTRAPNCGLLQ